MSSSVLLSSVTFACSRAFSPRSALICTSCWPMRSWSVGGHQSHPVTPAKSPTHTTAPTACRAVLIIRSPSMLILFFQSFRLYPARRAPAELKFFQSILHCLVGEPEHLRRLGNNAVASGHRFLQ